MDVLKKQICRVPRVVVVSGNGEKMKSEWKVMYNPMAGYAVYRIRDTSEVMHAGNVEMATSYMNDKACAQAIADEMNREEARKAKNEM